MKRLEVESFKLDIFQWYTNFSKKDSYNLIYYINKTYFENFNGKNKCEKNTSNIQDVCALKYPPLLWTHSQMEEITRENQQRDKRYLGSEQRTVEVHWQSFQERHRIR